MTTLYTAEWVLPVSSPPILNGAVAVHNGTIISVGTENDVRQQIARDGVFQVVSLDKAIICPGFVNVHSHLELTAMRGCLEDSNFHQWILKLIQLKEKLRPIDLQISARWGVIEAIKAGITTMADTCDSGAAMNALIEGGQRGIVFQESFGIDIIRAKKSLNELKRKITFLRRNETSLVKIGVSPHSPYTVSKLLFQLIAEYTEQEHLPLCIHVAESKEEEALMKSGSGPIGDSLRSRGIKWITPYTSAICYLNEIKILRTKPLLVHCAQVSEEDIDLIARSGARVAHCPKSNAKFGHGIAPILQMRKRGITVGLGTDSVVSNNICDLLDEARFTGLLHRVFQKGDQELTAINLLEMMTLGGAKALGLENRIGTLETGKEADITVVSLKGAHLQPVYNPVTALLFSASAHDVILTMVKGQVIYDGQQVLTIDEARLHTQLQTIAAQLT